MSRQNRVNPDHYKTAGRLTPDDLARERQRQSSGQLAGGRRGGKKSAPSWFAAAPKTREQAAAKNKPVRANASRRQSPAARSRPTKKTRQTAKRTTR